MSTEYVRNHKYVLKLNTRESLYYIEDFMPINGFDYEFTYKFSKYFFSDGIFYQEKYKIRIIKSNEYDEPILLIQIFNNYN